MKWQQLINLIAGLWLILSAFLQFGSQAHTWNYLIVGIVVGALSLWSLTSSNRPR